MSNTFDSKDYKKELSTSLNQKFPGLLEEWNQIASNFEVGLTEDLKQGIKEALSSFESFGPITVSVVLDNNFVFGQIKSMLKKQIPLEDSFIYRFLNSMFISAHGPFKLKVELYEKIDLYLQEDSAKAKEYADYLLSKISLEDAYWIEDWKKANQTIGHIDRDDIPYLALVIHLKSHAILSFDKIFQHQQETKVWNIDDGDRIITTFNKGIMSFSLFGVGIVSIEGVYKLLSHIVKTVFDIIKEIVLVIITLFGLGFELISKIPPGIGVLVLGAMLSGLIFSEEFRKKGADWIEKFKENLVVFIKKLIEDLKKFKEELIQLWEVFKPIGITSAQLIFYMSLEVSEMIDELGKLSNLETE